MKLHIGNGSIYLTDGFVNIDIPSDNVFLASERPDLVEKYSTTSDDYYSCHKDKTKEKLAQGPTIKETVTDRYGYLESLPVKNDSVDLILLIQTLEHFSMIELKKLVLPEIKRVMKIGGKIQISTPDYEESAKQLAETKNMFYARHIFGPRNYDRGYHTALRREDIVKLFNEFGFKEMIPCSEFIKHNYPVHLFEFIKI